MSSSLHTKTDDPVARQLQAACRELAWARRRQLELAMEGQVLSSARFAEYAQQVRRRIASPPPQWLAPSGGHRWQPPAPLARCRAGRTE